VLRMDEADRDALMRMAAFEHVRRLGEVHDHLIATDLKMHARTRLRAAILATTSL
jgi:hypothetical protein